MPYTAIEVPLPSLTPCPGHPPQPGQNDPLQEVSGFADGSGPLFSMYLKLAGEEDKKMTENWKGDADGILIFVGRHSTCHASTRVYLEAKDWFILCRRRGIRRSIRSGPQAKFPGHFSVLPRKHFPSPRRFEWYPGHYPPRPSQSVYPILPANLCCMGQLALVSQLTHQSHMCTFGDIIATMGASVHEGHPDTTRSTQTSTYSRVLCRGRRETSPSVGSRSVTCVVTPLSFPVLCGPRCVPFQYKSYGFQGGHIVDRFLYRDVHVHHVDAGNPA